MNRVLAVLTLAGALQGAVASAQTVACDIKLNVTDQDPAGLNVRATPGGAIVTALKAKGRWVQVHVTGQSGEWARIDDAREIRDETGQPEKLLFKGAGWVAFSKLGVEDFDSRARLFAAPNEKAKVVLSLEGSGDATAPAESILGCDGDWLRLRVMGVVGWTNAWCTNQLTTCV